MVDTHYDLLSICYKCYIDNDYSKIEKFSKEIISSGVKCIFANLYFMSKKEMIDELGANYYREDVSILDMFKISKAILEKFLPNIEFIYSIEGCDYLSIDDLEPLYNEGLRSLLLVWNEENRYGSGNRSDKGLTNEGRLFINKAIELGIGIDLSHANEPTFYGIIEVVKDNINRGKEVLCYASHSNSRRLYDRPRNLTDDELYALKSVNGYVGLLSNSHFISCGHTAPKDIQRKKYIEHILYVGSIIGFDKVMLSTDNMMFMADYDFEYGLVGIYNYSTIKKDIEEDLLKYISKDKSEDILFNNAYTIVNKLNNNIKKVNY